MLVKKFKCVIFDLDGVIVSTDQFHFLAWKALADREGIEFNQEINNRLRGVSRPESLEIILEKSKKKYSAIEKKEMTDYKNQRYVISLSQLGPKDILPEVIDLIHFLNENDILIAIGSSSKNTKTILKQIGLLDAFDTIVDGNDITHSKPHPEVFLKAAEKLSINPKDCIVVEDALAGINAAKSAGMFAVAVSDALKATNADMKATELSQMKTLFS
jgi:beta-phosphoglucomutase